jgi:FkbM family methyltransferase
VAITNRSDTCLDPRSRQVPTAPDDTALFVRWEDYVPKYLSSVMGRSFMQVGANCGLNRMPCASGGDPIWNYVVSCGWHGLAFEPAKSSFDELCRNYRPFSSRVLPLRGVISNTTGSRRFLTSVRSEISRVVGPEVRQSFDKNRRPKVTIVPSFALSDVWPQPDGVDVLVVDAEGSETEILGSSPLPEPLPALILFEEVHLSDRGQQIHANLQRQGFTLIHRLSHQDSWSVMKKERNPKVEVLYGRERITPRHMWATTRSDGFDPTRATRQQVRGERVEMAAETKRGHGYDSPIGKRGEGRSTDNT